MDKTGVIKKLRENRVFLNQVGVKKLYLFGSHARGEQTTQSDLDFVVELQKKSFDSFMDLKLFLEKLFECHVDLVLADSLKPRLRTHIMREMIDAA